MNRLELVLVGSVLLFYSPGILFAKHCSQRDWNQLLHEQQYIDRLYNQQAISFNQSLNEQRNQILIHKTFSPKEIDALLSVENSNKREMLLKQAESALVMAADLLHQHEKMSEQLPSFIQQAKQWQTMSTHCQSADKQLNSIAAQKYVLHNQALINDVKVLMQKYERLREIYLTEYQALRKAKNRNN
ncbi:hypothetical protein AB2S62_20890 [Vibrio sp. NTOU-M3]|uniref:hypothetical protein n=1 Tax=Vibrio sp. NTOU-M3 TaxID=3234954 RepID=UPI00349F85A4